MKKVISLLLALTVVLSLSVLAAAAAGKSAKHTAANAGTTAQDAQAEDGSAAAPHGNRQSDVQKQFRIELNGQKKELQQQKAALSQQKDALESQYEDLLASGDTEAAAAVQEQLDALNTQMQQIQSQIKQTINERFMVAKTMYSDTELAQFDSAADLIAQMYADAEVFEAGSVTVNNNLVKFDAPPYAKGGVTVVPLRAIAEQLGAEVSWDGDMQTVTVSKDGTVITLTENSTTVLVNGAPTEMGLPANVTCGRTYLPLRFLAEALNFQVAWDGENDLIDINDGTADPDTAPTDSPAPTDAA